ncbi:MAG: hypothetical protein R3E18_11640 [Sphingomonadaceae bacterium]
MKCSGTLALTVDGRGFASKISAGQAEDNFSSSECASCGACVQARPTSALMEKSVKQLGKPERSVTTTCAYCGVGCAFKAEMKGRTAGPHGAGRTARPIAATAA